MQPKSMATVVVRLPGTRLPSSIPAASVVIVASVVSGRISEMLPTVVVLPTPKPPAMTIFTGSGGRRGSASASGNCAEATDHSQQRVDVLRSVGVRQVDGEVAVRGKVADEHLDHAEVQAEPRRDLGDRQRLETQHDDVAALER